MLINLNRPEEATVYTHHALIQDPNPETLSIHAKALYLLRQYEEALHFFEQIIAEKPNNYIAIGQRALCLTQLNRFDEASEAYGKLQP